jgi:hypothetical protein
MEAFRRNHEPVETDEGEAFGFQDVSILDALGRRNIRGIFGKREGRDFESGVSSGTGEPGRVGEGPSLKDFVADGVAHEREAHFSVKVGIRRSLPAVAAR